ncbi:hypothetical protein [Streptomyces resistomycificus]|nr:hypothetical protein [Streptomyces resistomycificus]
MSRPRTAVGAEVDRAPDPAPTPAPVRHPDEPPPKETHEHP